MHVFHVRSSSSRAAVVVLLAALSIPLQIGAQETPPPGLMEVEIARSRACVGALERLEDLGMRLEPLARSAERLRALNQAIALEDAAEVEPFDESDPVESAVRDWFVADAELGSRYAETQDSLLIVRREEAKSAIRQRLQEAMESLRVRAESEAVDAEEIETAAVPCQGVLLVRSAVLEGCGATSGESLLCQAVADTTRSGPFRFVDSPEDLWDVEELRPWTDPTPLQVTPDGSLVGARTVARSRLGNIVVAVAFSPIIRERAQLDSTQAAEFDANLDSLGFSFDDPRFVMTPAFELQVSLPAPIGGETHYLLHFGDVAAPEILWSAEAGPGGVIQAAVPLSGADLNKFQAGQPLSFTAVAMKAPPEEGAAPEGEFVFSLAIAPVNQQRAATGLLSYMAGGALAEDLKRIIPPLG